MNTAEAKHIGTESRELGSVWRFVSATPTCLGFIEIVSFRGGEIVIVLEMNLGRYYPLCWIVLCPNGEIIPTGSRNFDGDGAVSLFERVR